MVRHLDLHGRAGDDGHHANGTAGVGGGRVQHRVVAGFGAEKFQTPISSGSSPCSRRWLQSPRVASRTESRSQGNDWTSEAPGMQGSLGTQGGSGRLDLEDAMHPCQLQDLEDGRRRIENARRATRLRISLWIEIKAPSPLLSRNRVWDMSSST